MKLFRQTAAAVAFAALTAFTTNAQQPAAGANRPATQRPTTQAPATSAPATQRPAAQTPAASAPATSRPAPSASGVVAIGEAKFAIINTEAFGVQQGGIARLVTAMGTVDREFQPRRTELQTMNTRLTQIAEDIKKTQNLADQATISKKAEEAETLKRDIERKQQDAQLAFEKRMREAVNPVYENIGKELEAFAKQNGISVIFDAAKMPGAMFVVNDTLDVTGAFIAYYNQRNPASSASTTTTPR
ncbi:MAG TPA: OmpH family outer membrane protein [Pyrinomonadaceae bacterium]|jgi:outer membrane protein|nr:OmpH family outer membrane protein [Pyrinomonadaceae bacterium]